MTTFEFGRLSLQDQKLEDAGRKFNIPINFLDFTTNKTTEPEEASTQKQIRAILSGIGLYCLHDDDWGVLIDSFNSNLSDLKNIADKIIDKYDGNISVFLEYQQFS